MNQFFGWAAIYLICAWLFSWWPFSPLGSGASLPLSSYEDVDVNVYFYFPNDKEVSLGQEHGASACGAAANAYAREKNMSRSDGWSYICCTIRRDSDCYEKIR
jgi:hypothetical protein